MKDGESSTNVRCTDKLAKQSISPLRPPASMITVPRLNDGAGVVALPDSQSLYLVREPDKTLGRISLVLLHLHRKQEEDSA